MFYLLCVGIVSFYLSLASGGRNDDSCSASIKGCEAADTEEDWLYRDMWGYAVDIYDPTDGWNDEKRYYLKNMETQVRQQSQALPQLTDDGYKVMKMPKDLLEYIKNETMSNQPTHEEAYQNFALQNWFSFDDKGKLYRKHNTLLFKPKNQKKFDKVINKALKPILEKWSGIRLKHSVNYGVRRYLEGSRVLLHVDKFETHVISAILQIDQKLEEKWPLYFVNHQGESKVLFIEPGDMVLYESAKLPHGRMKPFHGDYYDNMFVHFRPAKSWYAPNEIPNRFYTKDDLR